MAGKKQNNNSFYKENTVEVTDHKGVKHRVFKGEAENVKKTFKKWAERDKAKADSTKKK